MLTCYYKNLDTLTIAETTGEPIISNGGVYDFEFNILHSFKLISWIFVHFFGIGSVYSNFLWLKLLLDLKMRKKKERQTFRPHMGALFSAINSKINSKFL